ncbi:fatty acid desaturase [Azospirillum sp. TSA6c]|uniref:fatty acid desaturase family protein n=1 Tax=unclassified Azospirillum TaxID=2630922 RepID=UPI001FFF6D14|nr:fatty acid desaturase [Azospirillum sp. TSA6c]
MTQDFAGALMPSRNDVPAGDDAQAHLRARLRPYQTPSLARSLAQLATSVLPFIGCWALMVFSLDVSYAVTLLLSIPAAGLLVRIFIIQHDCGHGAFFRSRRANDAVGTLCGVMTLTPYANWRRQHAGHHANWNNLDRRNSGYDIYSSCLTLSEYNALGHRERLLHRLLRHPAVALILLPPLVFLVLYRFPFDTPSDWRKERLSVHATNLMIVVVLLGLAAWLGVSTVLLVQLPITILAAIAGVWLFSVQHRFEHTLWVRQRQWNPELVALRGSSYLRLPAILKWFTGNIGFHHIHHLNPRIPNYRLEECHRRFPVLQTVPALSLGTALSGIRLWLWDEAHGKLVPFPRG